MGHLITILVPCGGRFKVIQYSRDRFLEKETSFLIIGSIFAFSSC